MATRAKQPARKSATKKPAAKKPAAKKPAAKKLTGRKLAARKAAPSRGGGTRLAMSAPQEKPKSNFCVDHGRLLRADRTCPVSTCRFHTQPMP